MKIKNASNQCYSVPLLFSSCHLFLLCHRNDFLLLRLTKERWREEGRGQRSTRKLLCAQGSVAGCLQKGTDTIPLTGTMLKEQVRFSDTSISPPALSNSPQ